VIDIQGTSLIINYGCNRVRFPAPVPVGKRVRLGVTLNKVKDAPGGVHGTFELTFELESASKQACVAKVATSSSPRRHPLPGDQGEAEPNNW